ncbi:hypothetical protein NIES593_13715 [Hydrococcus rivularis NIES-593]|uniref:Uncharacterized protein n=1 Tax=Hydrococcus rivularis NIES-593 TaxID=1921803 RepID=A0A1U7HEM3_9CYAN|nr:hypothetical protein [Hydrococcus rivularis]OKH21991.1 hypothetical protein NIES593_13715 [Hydrococcus rivularis NIES-593]
MSNNICDRDVEMRSEQHPLPKSPIQRYLQNPFSIAWSKLAELFQTTQTLSQPEDLDNSPCDRNETESIRERYLYTCFTDRVDPSLYYTIFFPYNLPTYTAASPSENSK